MTTERTVEVGVGGDREVGGRGWTFEKGWTQTWRQRKRQVRGHHSPSSIQGEWLDIDDQKNNILASLAI